MTRVRDVDGGELEAIVAAGGPVLADFWSEGCRPCRALSPILAELSDEHPDVTFVKVDCDANDSAVRRHGILGAPTLLLWRDGAEHRRIVGVRPKAALEETVRALGAT